MQFSAGRSDQSGTGSYASSCLAAARGLSRAACRRRCAGQNAKKNAHNALPELTQLPERLPHNPMRRESRIQLFGGGAQLAGDAALEANGALGLAGERDDASGSEGGDSEDDEGGSTGGSSEADSSDDGARPFLPLAHRCGSPAPASNFMKRQRYL